MRLDNVLVLHNIQHMLHLNLVRRYISKIQILYHPALKDVHEPGTSSNRISFES